MLVRAKQMGFYGGIRRREGDEFKIKPDRKDGNKVITEFSERWMEKVESTNKGNQNGAR